MGQTIRGVSGSSPLSDGAGDAETSKPAAIGRYLARQRKLRGMDLDEVVAITRIPRRSLERLEGGAFDGMSDGFVRGFVRTVAVAIGLDPDETVARLLAEPELGPSHHWPRLGALIGIAAGVGLLLVMGAVLLLRLGSSEPVEKSTELSAPLADSTGLMRRDPVRTLAEEQRRLRQ